MKPLVYLSLGAGTQSSALLVMSTLELRGCPRADFAVFADTQDEAGWTYDHLRILQPWAESRGMPIHWVTRGRLSFDPVIRVPVFVRGKEGPAPLSQNCTRDYKITPIRRHTRRIMRERGIKEAEALIGISLDEADRMDDSGRKWLTHKYPLIDAGMKTRDCEQLLIEYGLPVPRKSACVFCPWRSGKNWLDLRDFDPDGWARAIAYDERVRKQRGAAVHRSLIPLRDVTIRVNGTLDLDGFSNECTGSCGV